MNDIEMRRIKRKASVIIKKAILRQYPIRGKIRKYSREQIANFLIDLIKSNGNHKEMTPRQQRMWNQIEADFDKWTREDKARKEGRL